MAERSLWTSFTGPPSAYTEGGPVTMGVTFTPSVDGLVTALKWYRGSTGAGILPQRIALWNRASGNKIAEVVGPTDNNTVGWKQYDLVSPAALSQGVNYSITFDIPANQTAYRVAAGSVPIPDTNLAWAANKRAYHAGAQNTYPEVTDNTFANLVDIVFDDSGTGPPPDDPATAADVEAILASWLNLGAGNDHVGQLPNQTYEELTDTTTGLPAVLTAINGVATDMLQADSAVITELRNAVDTVEPILVTALGAGGAMLSGALKTYLDGLQSSVQNSLQYSLQAQGGSQGIAATTDPGWTLVASGAFDGDFEVTDRCDRVYVSVDTVASGEDVSERLGHQYLSRYYWWEPVFGAFGGDHRTQRNVQACLYVEGMRMDGARVYVGNGRQGEWEAWRFDG